MKQKMTSAIRLIDDGAWQQAEIFMAVALVFVVALLVIPLPPVLLDLLLVTSMAASMTVLLVALQAPDPLDFSSFPAVLLMLTLYRLSLNVSSTRLILGEGDAGNVINAFGSFVVGGNYAVGIVIFLILVAINFVVITKGAGRVAEVAARFTLDAMPGRQMSIDGDLSAGLIDDEEARRRRQEINREADFYGAMDGAAKFVRGDAIAGLLITGINIVGGLFIGAVQQDMPLTEALQQYTLLTVGDGLVSQIPALIVSTAAGIMVTRTADEKDMGLAVATQIGSFPNAIMIAAGILFALGLVPGLPFLPFLVLSAGAGGLGWLAKSRQEEREAEEEAEVMRQEEAEQEDPVRELIQVDPIELEVGYALIPLVDRDSGGDLLDRISMLRKQAAQELGFLIPPIRIRDDVSLPSNEYVLRLRGSEIARAEVMPKMAMALDTGAVDDPVEGVETVDPSFGMPARWISPEQRDEAEARGYVVVEPTTVVATHLMESLKNHADEVLSRQDVQDMVNALAESYPALVDDVIPDKISLGTLHRVLQRLLQEQIPIRDMVTILESLADIADQTQDPEQMTEHVRKSLSKVIADKYADESGAVRGITVGPQLEASLMELFNPGQAGDQTGMLDPETLTGLLSELDDLWTESAAKDDRTPLISPAGLRVGIRRLIEPVLPSIPVVSVNELPPQVAVDSVDTWEIPDAA
ncbi:MAG: flagellar biosynthesis protein FlhA [Candidatus Palauibacterales bacterium]|nr:flagellar biosynthesis protein FlhA [Candidatus Palauibacterales bacterium]